MATNDVLDEEDAADLASFARQKERIERFVARLHEQPALNFLEPCPPCRAAVTRSELDELLGTYDEISEGARAFEQQDMSRVRRIVNQDKEQELSEQDLGMRDLALHALVALEELRSLLRQRGKHLDLLNVRLEWEAALALAQARRDSLAADIPVFLGKARWSIPAPLETSKKRDSINGRLRTSSSSSQNKLNHSASTSLMARRMRSDILNLEFAGLSQRTHTLSRNLITAAAKPLDCMIDSSPIKLPDCFFDVQDEAEDAIDALCDGMAAFLSSMKLQWRAADELYWAAYDAHHKAEMLSQAVESDLLKLPTKTKAQDFKRQYQDLETSLRQLLNQVDDSSYLPLPTHSRYPEQEELNQTLIKTLKSQLDAALRQLHSLEKSLKSYETAEQAIIDSSRICAQIEAVLERSRLHLGLLVQVAGALPSLSDACSFPTGFTDIDTSSLQTELRHAEQLGQEMTELEESASKTLEILLACGVDPNLRSRLRESLCHLLEGRRQLQAGAKPHEQQRIALDSLQRLATECTHARHCLVTAKCTISKHIETGLQSPIKRSFEPSEMPKRQSTAQLCEDIDARLSAPLADCLRLTQESDQVTQALEEAMTDLRQQLADVSLQDQLLEAICQQQFCAKAIQDDIEHQTKQLELWTATSSDARVLLNAQIEQLATLSHDLHSRLPFISSAAPNSVGSLLPLASAVLPAKREPYFLAAVPVDFENHNSQIRQHFNHLILTLRNRQEEYRAALERHEEEVALAELDSRATYLSESISSIESDLVKTTDADQVGDLKDRLHTASVSLEDLQVMLETPSRTFVSPNAAALLREVANLSARVQEDQQQIESLEVLQLKKSQEAQVQEVQLHTKDAAGAVGFSNWLCGDLKHYEQAQSTVVSAPEEKSAAQTVGPDTVEPSEDPLPALVPPTMNGDNPKLAVSSLEVIDTPPLLSNPQKSPLHELEGSQLRGTHLDEPKDGMQLQDDVIRPRDFCLSGQPLSADGIPQDDATLPKDENSLEDGFARDGDLLTSLQNIPMASTVEAAARDDTVTLTSTATISGDAQTKGGPAFPESSSTNPMKINRDATEPPVNEGIATCLCKEVQEPVESASSSAHGQQLLVTEQGKLLDGTLPRPSKTVGDETADVFSVTSSSARETPTPLGTFRKPELPLYPKTLSAHAAGAAGSSKRDSAPELPFPNRTVSKELPTVLLDQFQTAATTFDNSVSTLMDTIDNYESNDCDDLKIHMLACRSALDWVAEASEPIAQDESISNKLKQYRNTFQELESLIRDIDSNQPTPPTPALVGDVSSTASEDSCLSSLTYNSRARTISSSSRIPTLHVSKTRPALPTMGRSTSHPSLPSVPRSASYQRVKPSSQQDTAYRFPRSSSGSLQPRTVSSMSFGSSPRSLRTSSIARNVSNMGNHRVAFISSSIPPRNTPPRKKYKPSKKALDQAVANIVNELPSAVSIQKADDHHTDLSGRYLIGNKVYFCRILRSKVVMVRVGGGWLELSAFLRSHISMAASTELTEILPPADEVRSLSMSLSRPRLSSGSVSAHSSPKSAKSSPERTLSQFVDARWH